MTSTLGSSIFVRNATIADAHVVAEVHVASWREAYRDILAPEFLAGLSVDARQKRWAQAITQDSSHVLVVEVDGGVVGFSAFGRTRDEGYSTGEFEIWAIYLSPSVWSRGVGRELWHASRRALVERGARGVKLWVLASNARARHFYAAAGFEPRMESLKRIEVGGMSVDEICYWQDFSVEA